MKALNKLVSGFVIVLTMMGGFAMADSPITSTEFGPVNDPDLAIYSSETQLSNELAAILTSPDVTLENKLKLVNGHWDVNGLNNAHRLIAYIDVGDVNSTEEMIDEHSNFELVECMTPDTLAVYAYMLALDNYFDVNDAYNFAVEAEDQNPNSLGIAMVRALIESQLVWDDDLCRVYTVVDEVRTNTDLEQDLSPETLSSIFNYIGRYQQYCKPKT